LLLKELAPAIVNKTNSDYPQKINALNY